MSQAVDNLYVVLLGMGTVFFGLICIVLLCMLMSTLVRKLENPEEPAPAAVQAPPANTPTADRQAIIAASCALIAEELGEDVKNIKVVSFKKM